MKSAVFIGLLLLTSSLRASGPELEFIAASPIFEQDALEYAEIWSRNSKGIIAELESATEAALNGERIEVLVHEVVSSSGTSSEPMHMRASYSEEVKKGSLVHELGHRYLDAAGLDPRCVGEVHEVLSLVLYRVWSNLWGKGFATEQVAVESLRSERYRGSWSKVLSLTESQRRGRLREVLLTCRRLTMQSTRRRNSTFAQIGHYCRRGLLRR